MQKLEVYKNKPVGFNAVMQASACYLEIEGSILLLQLSQRKSECGTWGVPAGKLEKNEMPLEAARRELFEETGIHKEYSHFTELGCLYIRRQTFEYMYHLFQVFLDDKPTVRISDEHQSYGWFTIPQIHELPLLTGAKEGIEYYQRWAHIPTHY